MTQEILDKLKSHVHADDLSRGLSDHQIITAWQAQHGLKDDGILGPVTTRLVETPRFCGVKDRLCLGGDPLYRWDTTKYIGNGQWKNGKPETLALTYFISGTSSKLTEQQTHDAFAEAFGQFATAAAIKLVPIQSAQGANLVVSFGTIDGPSSVLAWCELPAGPETSATQLKMLVDDAEPFTIAVDPAAGYIDIVRTVRHEGGHFWGLPHSSAGNLMAPYYDKTIRDLQAGDKSQLVFRYGETVPDVTPPPVVPPVNPHRKCIVDLRFDDGAHFNGTVETTAP